MVKRIDALTDEQRAQMPAWAAKWIEIGLRTGETDWDTFERGARAAYGFAGLEQAKVIVRVQSPIVLGFAAPIASALLQTRPTGAVRGVVGGAVAGAVRDVVGGAVDGVVRTSLRTWHRGYIGGQFWVGDWYWYGSPAMVSFFRDVCGIEFSDDIAARARAYQDTTESACWWWAHKDFIMVCARPRSIHRDARGRLHNETGAAIDWPDGWGVYAIHGVRIPRDVIESPETITTARINSEPNAEVRRIMLERYGLSRYIRDSKAERVHKDDWAALWKIPAPTRDDEPLMVAEVINSTPEPDGSGFKTYFLTVPPTMRTGRQAVAWTFGIENADDYAPVVQT